MTEEYAIEILQRAGFDIDLGDCFIRFPYRANITKEQDEAVQFLVEQCKHTVVPSGDD
jgi:hypothetical protein